MRILRLSTYLEGGGAESSIHLYLKEMSKKHEIVFAYLSGTSYNKNKLESWGVKVVKLDFSLRGIAKLIALYLRFKPKVVHTTLYKAELFGLLLKILFRCRLVTNRDADVWRVTKRKYLYGLLDNVFHKYIYYPVVDRIICITHYVRWYVLNKLNYKSPKLEVLYYGINPDIENIKVKASKYKRIIFVGRLEEQKGIDVFLSALSKIKFKEKVLVYVYGKGTYEEIIKRYIPLLKERNIYLELRGFVPDIKKIYGDADIMFLPTQYEGFGLVFLEALSTKHIVVLTSRIKPLDEVLGNHAYFCDRQDAECFAQNLKNIVENFERYREVQYRGVEKHLSKFDLKVLSNKLEDIYAKL